MTLPRSYYPADQLDAIWVTYQTQGTASCPNCGAKLTFDLTNDGAKGDTSPMVAVRCSSCGRQGVFNPGDRNDSEQDPV